MHVANVCIFYYNFRMFINGDVSDIFVIMEANNLNNIIEIKVGQINS